MILELLETDVDDGARLKPAAEILGLSSRTLFRWRRQEAGGSDQRKGLVSSFRGTFFISTCSLICGVVRLLR